MPLQTKNNCSGNGARRRVVNNRVWAYRNEIAAKLAPPVEDKLEEIQAPRVRQANRRKTDATDGRRVGDEFRVVTVKDACSGPMISIGDKIREDEDFARSYATETSAAKAYGARRQAEKKKEMEGEI